MRHDALNALRAGIDAIAKNCVAMAAATTLPGSGPVLQTTIGILAKLSERVAQGIEASYQASAAQMPQKTIG